MYLEPWMIMTLILSFGLCAVLSRRVGFYSGATQTLMLLEEQKLIKVDEDGSIKRWAPYNDTPAPKKKRIGGPRTPK